MSRIYPVDGTEVMNTEVMNIEVVNIELVYPLLSTAVRHGSLELAAIS